MYSESLQIKEKIFSLKLLYRKFSVDSNIEIMTFSFFLSYGKNLISLEKMNNFLNKNQKLQIPLSIRWGRDDFYPYPPVGGGWGRK